MSQSILPVIVIPLSKVVGMVPLPAPVEFVGDEESLQVGDTTYKIHWHMIRAKFGGPPTTIACIPMTPTEERQRLYPAGFLENPFEKPRVSFNALNVLYRDPPLATYWYAYATGREVEAVYLPPEGTPVANETVRWSLVADFALDAECVYVDLDWTALGAEGDVPVSVTFTSPSPSIQMFLVSAGIVPTMSLGATVAMLSPTLRVFRAAAVTPGIYTLALSLLKDDGTTRPVEIELTVPGAPPPPVDPTPI